MKLLIVRRWGSAVPGDTVTVDDDQQAQWLLDNNFAERTNQPGTASGGSVAPGADGPDPRAGGDHTRRFPSTRKGEYGPNRARPASGSPIAYTAGVREDEPEASGERSESAPQSKAPARRRSKSDA